MSKAKRLTDREIKVGQVVFALVVATFSIVLFIATPFLISNFRTDTPFQLSPAFYPKLALIVSAIGGVGHVLHVRFGGQQPEENDEFEVGDFFWSLVLVGSGLFLAYALFVPWIGYGASTFLFVFLACRLSGVTYSKAFLYSFVSTVSLYGLFVLFLKVWFPDPELLRLFVLS